MERRNILNSQKEEALSWKEGFYPYPSEENYEYYLYEADNIGIENYCKFLGLDYKTLALIGNITYSVSYHRLAEERVYILRCTTAIDGAIFEKLSFELEDDEDYLGFYGETRGDIGVARWLPGNWKELITDEQLHDILQERNIQTIECLQDNDVPDEMKERIARDWCKENSAELRDYLDEDDKEEIAENYIEDNYSDSADKAYNCMSSYEQREFVKDCIDNL